MVYWKDKIFLYIIHTWREPLGKFHRTMRSVLISKGFIVRRTSLP